MFTEAQLEKILQDPDIRSIPLCYKYTVIRAVEKMLEEEEENATISDISKLY